MLWFMISELVDIIRDILPKDGHYDTVAKNA